MARRQRGRWPAASGGPGGGRRRRRAARDRFRPRKYTRINVEQIDYKDLAHAAAVHLRPRQGPLAPRHRAFRAATSSSSRLAVKRAREIALLPYVGER